MRKSKRLRVLGVFGFLLLGFILFLVVSVNRGGHMAGPTYIAPGNVGLVIDNYRGDVEQRQMPAGLHWQGIWETVIEVPTAQRTISLDRNAQAGSGARSAVLVNTASNMLTADVTAQYSIIGGKAGNLYSAYQDQFADIDMFEGVHLVPAIKEAIWSW